ncbi:DMT family transporter [Teredinibacter turnerae]|uniref:DMT family transporter n=1 Tax=Teredinibacter turnerae TaxID=2426 RepID=UPI0005F8357C|nr:DMT family transporter [Teredinibacter turnerae]
MNQCFTSIRYMALLTLALLALAGNSLLCRAALLTFHTDPALFTGLRIASGCVALALLVWLTQRKQATATHKSAAAYTLLSASVLYLYFLGFSYAYITLDSGTGALVLFGCVQLTMSVASLWRGQRLHLTQWVGMSLAMGGLYLLVAKGISGGEWPGYAFMAAAGLSWGIYTLLGRNSLAPVRDTCRNFFACLPLCGLSFAALLGFGYPLEWQWHWGSVLAVLSGAITSALGYALWFYVVRDLDRASAGICQLTVPLLAAGGGALLLGEPFTATMLAGALLILGGVLLSLLTAPRRHATNAAPES